jgi:hypothetical protein
MIPKILFAVVGVVAFGFFARSAVILWRKEARGEPIPPDPMDGMIQPAPGPTDIPPDAA